MQQSRTHPIQSSYPRPIFVVETVFKKMIITQENVCDWVTWLYKRTWQNIVNQWYFNDNNNNNNENKRKTHLAEVGWGVVCSERQGPKEPLSEVSSKGFLE